jgi:hypothetical protein
MQQMLDALKSMLLLLSWMHAIKLKRREGEQEGPSSLACSLFFVDRDMQLPARSVTQDLPVEGEALCLLWLVIICKWVEQFVACSKQQLDVSSSSPAQLHSNSSLPSVPACNHPRG